MRAMAMLNMKVICSCLLMLFFLQTGFGQCYAAPATAQTGKLESRPNILLIVIDDLGFTDLGIYGGDVPTPNMDALGNSGVQLNRFYTAPTCSPTRSMLLSGTDNHLAGLGNMVEVTAPNQKGKPGYEGHLPDKIVPLPRIMKDAGYRTYMTGKWHLGLASEQGPHNKGFERSFVLLDGAASHLTMRGPEGRNPIAHYRDDGQVVESLPEDFYSSDFYTDRMLEYLSAEEADNRPFFAYLSYTALHWPLQAPDIYLDKYQGYYDRGWDLIREERFEKTKALGLIPSDSSYPARHPEVPAWNTLTPQQKKSEARLMEIYAAMLDNLDHNIGKLVKFLKDSGKYNNTFIFLMSDNGAEGQILDGPLFDEWIEKSDNLFDNMGKARSYLFYGPQWAQVSTAPFYLFKAFTSEGGIRAPAIVHYPLWQANGKLENSFITVMDVMPSLLELAQIPQPVAEYRGRPMQKLRGSSMLAVLKGEQKTVHKENYVMGWELFGRRAIRQDKWKLLWIEKPAGPGQWQLFDVEADPAEQHNLAKQEPVKLDQMLLLWEQYKLETGLILPEGVIGY